MNWEMLLGVGVVSVILTSITNIVLLILNNKTLRSINNDKFRSELVVYRFTNLYSLLQSLETKNFMEYTDDYQRTAIETFNTYFAIYGIYQLAKPLINSSFRAEVDNLVSIIVPIYKNDIKEPNSSDKGIDIEAFKNFHMTAFAFRESLQKTIQNQIEALTN